MKIMQIEISFPVCISYGRFDHEDWCTHKSALCTWNLDRRNINPDKPDTVIDLSCCLMCIACHPKKPSLIAGGTFNGNYMQLLILLLMDLLAL